MPVGIESIGQGEEIITLKKNAGDINIKSIKNSTVALSAIFYIKTVIAPCPPSLPPQPDPLETPD